MTADAIAPFLARGYRVVREEHHAAHFGNALVVLEKGSIGVRLIRDRGEWFAEVGSADAWFDSAILFRDLGEEAGEDLLEKLASTAPRWEPLFQPETHAETGRRLEGIQRLLAQRDWLGDFQRTAIEALSFLVDEYGFVLEDSASVRNEAYARYRRGDGIAVTENYEVPGGPWMTVTLPREGKSVALERLAKENGIPWPEADSMREAVMRDAAVLREWLSR